MSEKRENKSVWKEEDEKEGGGRREFTRGPRGEAVEGL